MEHNAVTGLTAQDVVKEASVPRILRIIAPYAIISDNFLRFIECLFRDYGFMRAFIKLAVIFDLADIYDILQDKLDVGIFKLCDLTPYTVQIIS